MTTAAPDRLPLIADLRTRALDVLRPLLGEGGRFALLDYPNYANVGDSAIWLGTRALLRDLGATVAYASTPLAFRREMLDTLAPGAPILIQGGGNLGDLWPLSQRFREHVIRSFPDRPIIQLSQSIHFRERANLDAARAVFDAHPNLTLLLRDRRSLAIARAEFRATSLLCPDLAFGLGPLRRARKPGTDVVWLMRDDAEAIGARPPASLTLGQMVDWAEDGWPTSPMRRLLTSVARPRLLGRRWTLAMRAYDALAAARLASGARLLSRGRAVITDRLHAHILCVLLGIPHVVLDNNYGKISSFMDEWTGQLPQARRADRIEIAATEAQRLAERPAA